MRFVGTLLVLLPALALRPAAARAAGDAPTNSPPAAKKSTGKAKSKHGAPAATRATPHAKTTTARGSRPKQATALRAGLHPVSDVQVTPFPSHAAETQKALAQNRRDQLEDAEKVARAAEAADRWQTVLFHLRDFDARSDAEACFWRVLAYYRLGEIGRARSIRQLCTLAAKEEAILDGEDAACGVLQPSAALPEMLAAGEHPPAPVANPTRYAGAAPARLDR